MPVSANTLRMLMDAGLSGDELLAVVASIDADAQIEPKPKSGAALRQQRYRDRKSANVTSDVTSDVTISLSSPEGSSPTPPSPKPLQSIPPSPPKGGSSPTDRAIDVFAEQASKAGLPVPRKVTADRRRKIEARLREHGDDVWAEACRRMAASAFCRGENDRGWRADLDFLCQPKSFNGLLEGKYDDRPQTRSQAPPPNRETEFARHQRECTEALERRVLGEKRNDEFASNGPAFDLEPRDWRPH